MGKELAKQHYTSKNIYLCGTQDVNTDIGLEKYPVLPDPWETVPEEQKPEQEQVSRHLHVADLWGKLAKSPEPFEGVGFKDLHVPLHYEGLCLPLAKPVGKVGKSVSEDEKPQVGELNGEVGGVFTGFSGEQQPQAVSDLVEIPTGTLNPEIIFINGIISEISSIREIINSKSTKFLIHQIHLEYDFEQFIDNQNLSATGGGVSPKIDKQN